MISTITLNHVILFAFGGSGIVGFFLVFRQILDSRRAHLFTVYKEVFLLLDEDTVRDARHYVYKIDRDTYQKEDWINITSESLNAQHYKNKTKAEITCRRFDTIGFFLLEGRIPIDIIAKHYSYPVLKCWYQLAPYVRAIRSINSGGRNQQGHMWYWETMVYDYLIPSIKKGKGVWSGVLLLDDLSQLIKDLGNEDRRPYCKDFRPKIRIWKTNYFGL